MMRVKSPLMLVAALCIGGVSVVMLKGWVDSELAGRSSAAQATVPIVVSRTALPFGSRLHKENLMVVTWPAESVPVGTFSTVEELIGKGEERVVLRSMEAAEPVLTGKISGIGGRATLSTVVSKDLRAVTIRVNDVLGVAGFVLPGDRVDVLLTRKENERAPTNDVLLQNVRVLGIDQDSSDRKDKPMVARAVTLEVGQDQAQMLTLGGQVGVLSLALRNQGDSDVEKVRTVGLSDLGPAKPAFIPTAGHPIPVARPVSDPGARIGIIRGTESATYAVRRE